MTVTAPQVGTLSSASPSVTPSSTSSSVPATVWPGVTGAVCAVTGAAGGIGLEIVRALLQAGAKVALLDRDEASLERAMRDLASAHDGTRALALTCDVTSRDSMQTVADQIAEKWAPVSVLVNNAAALYADALMDIALDKWERLMSVNLTGYLLCAQIFGKQMMARGGGAMVHVTSISGRIPQPFSGAYSVSKAGAMMLSQLLAVELGEHGVRSNVVSPAMIRTPMSESIYTDDAVRRHREAIVPLRRIGMPTDIASAVLFLASDHASYVSGQELLVDGGLTQAWLGMIPRPGFQKADAAAQRDAH